MYTMSGRPSTCHVVMTGSTRGFGRLTAERLVARGDISLRTHHRDEAARPPAGRGVQDRRVDLADLVQVAAWGAEVAAQLPQDGAGVSVLLNAGLQVPQGPRTSVQGVELQLAVNHLAHVLLLDRLLPRLPAGSCVVVTSSGTHRGDAFSRAFGIRAPRLEPVAVMARPDSVPATRAEGLRRYATSKLCNALHVTALAAERPDLRVVAYDPGLVPGTGLARGAPRAAQALWHSLAPALRLLPGANAAQVSADGLAELAEGGVAPLTGSYVEAGRGVTEASEQARDVDVARRLLAESRQLLDGLLPPG